MQQDDEVESGIAEGSLDCGEIAGQRLDPENGSTEAAGYLQGTADRAKQNGLSTIVKTIVENTGELPSIDLLFAAMVQVEHGGDTSVAVFTSLAEQLMREKLEQEQLLEAEHGL